MPGTYPAAPPTMSGDLETISRFPSSPAQIRRRLRDYMDRRFVADQILTQRFRPSGGAALYELSEPFVTDRAVEAVGAGAEYPYANMPTGTAGVASGSKWGQKGPGTHAEVPPNLYPRQSGTRAPRQNGKSIIHNGDGGALS